MTIRLGVVMDPIANIHYKKDSTLAMLWAAAAKGWDLYYFEPADLYLQNNVPLGHARKLQVFHDAERWFALSNAHTMALADLDIILMRKDPPFNADYIYLTYLLEHAERLGVLVVNRPQSLRDANEKLFATYFPECMPKTMVTASINLLHEFWQEHPDIVCKPLDGMGGASVYRLRASDVNANAIFAALTLDGKRHIMAQQFIPEIVAGDKRILMLDGEPFSYALARVPQGNDWRGNLAVGAKGHVQALTLRDQFICAKVGPTLRARGLYFVGLDVVGDYLTEINVTSPTGIRELDMALGSDISAQLLDLLAAKIKK